MSLLTLGAHAPKGYSNRFCVCVCVSICLSVTTLAAIAFVCRHKLTHHRLLYDDFLDFDSQISLKGLCSRDMVLFAYHRELGHFLPP